MKIFGHNPQSFFCFDETAAGTGGASPPGGTPAAATPAPSSSPAPAAPAASPAAPSAAPSGASPPAAGVGSDPFSGLDGSWDDLDEITISDAATGTDPGTAPIPPAAPVAAVPAAAAPGATAPVPPAAAPVAPVAVPAPAQTAPASARALLDETVDGFKTNQVELAKWAGENLFKLSNEDAEALATDAAATLPRLGGMVYAQALVGAGNLVRNLVPHLIAEIMENHTTKTTKSTEAIGAFYKTHSDLNEKDHGTLVSQWAKAFRSANPKATREEAIDYVGRAVRIQAGLPMPGTTPAPAVRAQPFSPARPGGRPPQTATEHDPYAGLGMDLDEGA